MPPGTPILAAIKIQRADSQYYENLRELMCRKQEKVRAKQL